MGHGHKDRRGLHQPLDEVDLDLRLDKESYVPRIQALQHRLHQIETAYRHQNMRAVIVLEGWDAAGKGGLIRRLTAHMDPRGFQVWPIGAPNEQERARHYLERFWTRLPGPGNITIFDRSWYGRVLVERVERLIPESSWRTAYDEIRQFELMLARDGVRLVKLFLHISDDTQARRFRSRFEDPWKRWKLTKEDFRNRSLRPDYYQAINEMILQTSTETGPWHLIAFNNKRYGRIAALEVIDDCLSAGIDQSPPPIDPDIRQLLTSLPD